MQKTNSPSRRELYDQKVREENIAKILEGAEKVFSEKGYDGARMADLAEAAGLAKANLYYYFANKEAIYRYVIEELLARWDGALHVISSEREPGEAISEYIRAKIRYSQEHPAASKILAKEVISGSRFLSIERERATRIVTKEKVQVIKSWVDKGKMANIDAYHLFFMLWGTTQYYADMDGHIKNVMGIKHLNDDVYQDAIDNTIAIVLKGCGIRS